MKGFPSVSVSRKGPTFLLEGSNYTFNCTSRVNTSYGNITLEWTKNGVLVDAVVGLEYNHLLYTELVISNATLNQSGIYHCTARNRGLQRKAEAIKLIVGGKYWLIMSKLSICFPNCQTNVEAWE